MALIPLNKFLTKTRALSTATTVGNTFSMNTGTTATVYTAPIGVTSILLMAQIANVSTQTQEISFIHHRNRPVLSDAQGNGAQPGNVDTYLVRDFAIPPGDAASILTGKLIVESLDSVRAYIKSGTSAAAGTCQLTLSVLETANN
jgi:hypothetical protein